jgi:RHS repeat-associated protein
MTKNGNNYYFHLNDRKDVIKITDESQNIVASYEYDAWGNIISSSGSFANQQPFKFASYYYDSSVNLYYLINRYYDPGLGRFISKDKFRRSNPDSLDLNPYLYVRNNPVNKTDPDGYGTLDNKRLATVWLARPDLQAAFPRVNPNNYNGVNEADWGRLETWAKNLSDSGARWVMSESGAIPPDVNPDRLGTVWIYRSDLQNVFSSVDSYRHTGADWGRLEDWARDNWNKDPFAWWALTGKGAPFDYGSGIIDQPVATPPVQTPPADNTPPTQTAPVAPVTPINPAPPVVAPPVTPEHPLCQHPQLQHRLGQVLQPLILFQHQPG